MSTLADYQDELAAITAAMDGEEFTEADVAGAVDAWLSDTEGLAAKLDAYAAVIAEREQYATIRQAEAARLAALAKSDAARAAWLRTRLHDFFRAVGRSKIETDLHKFSIQANGGRLPLLVENGETIPERFWHERTVTELDKEALREALEAGAEVPGARLGDRGTRLSIR